MDNFAEFYQEGGFWMHFIALSAVIGAGVTIERFIFLFFRFNINGGQFFNQIQKLVMANNIDRAIKLCNAAPAAALPKVVKAGLTRANKGSIEIQNAMEEATLEVVPEIQKRTQSLWTIANLATLIGLLGTIFGLINCFRAVGLATPDQKSRILGEGIAEAMNNTAYGLLIAIFCMVFHLILTNLTKKIIEDIDQYSVKLENLLIARNKGTLPAPQQMAEQKPA
jgi:biopolymer transport protein ExbB/TolQ